MQTIYKYPITSPVTVLKIPRYSKVLSVIYQDPNIVIYFLVDSEQDQLQIRTVRVYGTGHSIVYDNGLHVDLELYQFVGTVSMTDIGLIWHVWVTKDHEE